MGKFPHSSLKAQNIFPIHGLAVIVKKNFPMNHERHIIYGGAGVVKINFPMSGEAANGEIYFHHDCCAIYYVP